AVHQLPDRHAGAVGVESIDGLASVRGNARVAGEEQTFEDGGSRAAAVFFVVERGQNGGRKCTGAVAAKRNHFDRPATRHRAAHGVTFPRAGCALFRAYSAAAGIWSTTPWFTPSPAARALPPAPSARYLPSADTASP